MKTIHERPKMSLGFDAHFLADRAIGTPDLKSKRNAITYNT